MGRRVFQITGGMRVKGGKVNAELYQPDVTQQVDVDFRARRWTKRTAVKKTVDDGTE